MNIGPMTLSQTGSFLPKDRRTAGRIIFRWPRRSPTSIRRKLLFRDELGGLLFGARLRRRLWLRKR